jgi:hypothetical protein
MRALADCGAPLKGFARLPPGRAVHAFEPMMGGGCHSGLEPRQRPPLRQRGACAIKGPAHRPCVPANAGGGRPPRIQPTRTHEASPLFRASLPFPPYRRAATHRVEACDLSISCREGSRLRCSICIAPQTSRSPPSPSCETDNRSLRQQALSLFIYCSAMVPPPCNDHQITRRSGICAGS